MNPRRSRTFQSNEKLSSFEHDTTILYLKTKEEKLMRRQKWLREQELERQHEKLKQQKILEYERKRAQALKYSEEKSLQSSGSPINLQRDRLPSSDIKSDNLHEKLDRPISETVSFNGSRNIQIDAMELRQIIIEIDRNIPIIEPISELQRGIVNPEDVIIKRREGEGCKPIFDRNEIKEAAIKTDEIEKQSTIVAIDEEHLVSTSKSKTSRKHSSLSPIRSHSNSRYLSGCQSKHTHSEYWDNKTKNNDICKNNGSNIENHKEHKYTERDASKHGINRSRSKEPCNSHSRSFMEERTYLERSNKCSHERSDRDRNKDRDRDRGRFRSRSKSRSRSRSRSRFRSRSRERKDVAPHYIESSIPMPLIPPMSIYYGSFPSRPIVVRPMVPLRGQIPPMGRGRHLALMAPVRPFSPRFVPPDMHRLGHLHPVNIDK